MGLTQSTQDTTPKIYTDNEIKTNIQKLFSNNRKNNLSEASGSIRNLDDIKVSAMESNKLHGGSHIKFNSSKNRHLAHNLDEFLQNCQDGGNYDMEPISELSELNKIKDFLINMNEDKQIGGALTTESEYQPKMRLFDVLKQISMNGGAKEESDSDEDLDFDENDSDEKKDDDMDEDEDDEEDNDDGDISSTSDKPINENEKFSETSYSTKQSDSASELNILPFYSSSDTDNFKHPYNKNRFN